MNKERMLALADFIEKLPPKRFDMSTWGVQKGNMGYTQRIDPTELNVNDCGTRACLAGWTIFLFEKRPRNRSSLDSYSDRAGRLLDLDEEEVTRLFYGAYSPNAFYDITATEAAQQLRTLATEETR